MVSSVTFGNGQQSQIFKPLTREDAAAPHINIASTGSQAIPAARMSIDEALYGPRKESHTLRNIFLTILGAAVVAGGLYAGARRLQHITPQEGQKFLSFTKDWSAKIARFGDDAIDRVKNLFRKKPEKTE